MRHFWPSLLVLAACAAHHPPTVAEETRASGSETAATPTRVALTPVQVARAELERLAKGQPLRRAAVVVMEPRTGRVLALVGFGPDGDRQALDVVPTGSTLKPFTIAAALEAGLDPGRRFDGENGTWRLKDGELHDASPSDWLDATRVVVRSSNIGAAKVAAELGTTGLRTLLAQLEFERAPWPTGEAAPLPSALAWEGEGGLRFAAGGGTTASLLHLTAATAIFAQGGVYVRPSADGTGPATRVLSEKSAQSVARMLELAVGEGTGTQARGPGVRVAGKTGTAPREGSTWGHFIGFAPVANPRWVVGVSVEGPGSGYTGGTVAAPAFARVVAALEAQPRVR